MKINRSYATAVAAMVVLALGVGWATAEQAGAATSADKIVGNTAAARFEFKQSTFDCEVVSADVIYGLIKGSRMKEATILKEATKLGVFIGTGSSWDGPNGIVKLLAHYGIRSGIGSHKISTIEGDLARGDRVIAAVNANVLWNPMGYQAIDTTSLTVPDHAVVLDQIDETAGTATVSDSGFGITYTVPLATWLKAVYASGSSYDIIPVQK